MIYSKQLSISAKRTRLSLGDVLSFSNSRYLFFVNILIMALVAVLLFVYLFMANSTVSQKFRLGRLRSELNEISTHAELLYNSDSRNISPDRLNAFAAGKNMVKSKNHGVVFTERGYASAE